MQAILDMQYGKSEERRERSPLGRLGGVLWGVPQYFGELLDRSLFQEPEIDKHGSITSCKMHDVVHELAQWVTKIEFSVMKTKDPKNRFMSLGNVRHCAISRELE